jgi:hypothetical protein
MEEVFQDGQETYSPKRDRDDLEDDEDMGSNLNKPTLQSKRLRKIKPLMPPVEKDRTRGRYACLGHRMKHKRCPLDCPDRRPKAASDQMEGSDGSPKEERPQIPLMVKNRTPRTSAKKNVLKLEECSINKSPLLARESQPVAIPHASSRDHREPHQNWDSVAWEGLSWDEHSVHSLKDETYVDLKSSSHWEESKARGSFEEGTKPTDDLTKFEEEEIVDSWLNEDGFSTNPPRDFEIAEKNPCDPDTERRHSPTYMAMQCRDSLPKILLTRDMVERWLTEPYFNRLIKGCLVRVQIGEYMGSPLHRIAHIDDVFDNCYYPYGLPKGGQTTKGLSLQVAASNKKTFPILSISNHPPTEQDFRNWQEEMERSGVILDPLELQQKEEIVRVLHIKYPMEFIHPQPAEPIVREPTIWSSC